MTISEKAMELENRSIGSNAPPVLGATYELLRDRWRSDERNRELALHLMFLAWYLIVEPAHLTGLDETRVPTAELRKTFNDAHDWLLPIGDASTDVEALYVAGLPAHMFPWALGDEHLWAARSAAYRVRYRQLEPQGIDPAVFDGRGAYGDYYGGQGRVVGGF